MRVTPDCLTIAAAILSGGFYRLKHADDIDRAEALVPHLNNQLKHYLQGLDEDMTRLGGTLRSRQAVAIAVSTWRMLNPDKEPYDVKKV